MLVFAFGAIPMNRGIFRTKLEGPSFQGPHKIHATMTHIRCNILNSFKFPRRTDSCFLVPLCQITAKSQGLPTNQGFRRPRKKQITNLLRHFQLPELLSYSLIRFLPNLFIWFEPLYVITVIPDYR